MSGNHLSEMGASSSSAGVQQSQQACNAFMQQHLTERSAHSVAIKCLKQISELIGYMGKSFCAVSFPRTRQRVQQAAPAIDQTTLRKHSLQITTQMFEGIFRLLLTDDANKEKDANNKANLRFSKQIQILLGFFFAVPRTFINRCPC